MDLSPSSLKTLRRFLLIKGVSLMSIFLSKSRFLWPKTSRNSSPEVESRLFFKGGFPYRAAFTGLSVGEENRHLASKKYINQNFNLCTSLSGGVPPRKRKSPTPSSHSVTTQKKTEQPSTSVRAHANLMVSGFGAAEDPCWDVPQRVGSGLYRAGATTTPSLLGVCCLP